MGSTIGQTRNHIEKAEQCLKKSQTKIEERRKYFEEHMEKLTKEKENVKQQNTARHNTGIGVTVGGAVLAAVPIIGWIP
ncbi:hypothetical protein M9458_044812, partial [Cirrhinus mrigala]